jgi:hypothetical protein
MFGLASTTHGELSGTIHAIDGMCFIRSGEGRMTYTTTMNNAKHDNRVNRVQLDDLQHRNGKHNNGKHNNGKQYNNKQYNGQHYNEQWQGQKCSHSGESD